jgi:transketolase
VVPAPLPTEAGSTRGWERYVGAQGTMIGMREFGASAPVKDLMTHFGFTPQDIASAAQAQVAKWDNA